MVTRRAVLKGTAAASIGAIAAAHGAATAEAAVPAGFGVLAGGAAGGFYKYRDAFQVALKFHKIYADIFFKEEVTGGVSVFLKFFQKDWTALQPTTLGEEFFKDLQTSELYFSKIQADTAEFFLKNNLTESSVQGSFTVTEKGLSYELNTGYDNPVVILE